VGHGSLLQRQRDRLPLPRGVGHEHRNTPRLHRLARDQPLDVTSDRLGLGAVVGAAPQLELTARGAFGCRPLQDRAGRLQHPFGAPQAARQGHDPGTGRLKAVHPPLTGSAKTAQSLTRIARDGQPRAGHLTGQPGRCQIELLGIVEQQLIEGAQRPGALLEDRQRLAHEVAGVRAADLVEDPLVGSVDLGELALALGLRSLGDVKRGGPAQVLLGSDQLRFEPVDPRHEAR
jgi:hypothetical protein